MDVMHGLESAALTDVVLTIGNFDGVHRGHQAILAAGRRRADAAGAPLVAMTFDPHPLAILTPDHVPPTLTPLHEKLRCLERAGTDGVVVVRSTPAFLNLSADAFLTQVIVGRFRPVAVVEGASFGFGRHRQGNVETLRAAAPNHGFEVEVVEPVRIELGGHPGTVVSSSFVRQLIQSGTMDQARLCLGRPYALFGRVGHGAGRGRGLGFPTANLLVEGQLVPGEGVYAGRTRIGDRWFAAAVSIGRNPTFDGETLSVEAHLLDFDGDVYEQDLRVELIEWLRDQRRFASPEALREQIDRDVTRTREVVAEFAD